MLLEGTGTDRTAGTGGTVAGGSSRTFARQETGRAGTIGIEIATTIGTGPSAGTIADRALMNGRHVNGTTTGDGTMHGEIATIARGVREIRREPVGRKTLKMGGIVRVPTEIGGLATRSARIVAAHGRARGIESDVVPRMSAGMGHAALITM